MLLHADLVTGNPSLRRGITTNTLQNNLQYRRYEQNYEHYQQDYGGKL